MIKIEKKIVKNKPFFYLTEQINIGSCFKKIQAYIGKNIPNDLSEYYKKLQNKEIGLVNDNIENIYILDSQIPVEEYKKVEILRVKWKYFFINLSDYKKERFWRDFAIQFIFESNAIEGSKLSQKEVEKIIKKQYIKKTTEKKEIIEVNNAIKAFELIRGDNFKLNQRSIIELHKLVTCGLGIETGYKKANIIVNNKKTVLPKDVRKSMSELLIWQKAKQKKKLHPFIRAAIFHNRFEYIHPFIDGNGRVGRLLFVWMLLKSGYGLILFKNKNRISYFSALDQADNGRPRKLFRHSIRAYKKTIQNLPQ
ncbi:Fic family protein [Candidatus Parcubacteria bacterium]|nr:Fic family protein [Candidatus Parcubacteria bacterium]